MKTLLLSCLIFSGLNALAMGFIKNCEELFHDDPAMGAMLLSFEAEVRQTALSKAVLNLLQKEIKGSDSDLKTKFVDLAQFSIATGVEDQVFGLLDEEKARRAEVFESKKNALLGDASAEAHAIFNQKLESAFENALDNADQLVLDAKALIPETKKELQKFFDEYVKKEKSKVEQDQIYNSQTHNKDYIQIFDRWVLEATGETFAPGFTSQPEDPDDDEPLSPKVGFRD